MGTLILIICVLAGFSLVWWYVGTLTIAAPVKNTILVIMGLVALVIIYNFSMEYTSGNGFHLRR